MQWFLQVNRNQMGERWLHFYEAITQPLEGQGKEPRPGDGVVSDFPPCHPPPPGTQPPVSSWSHPRDSHSREMGRLHLDISQLESS